VCARPPCTCAPAFVLVVGAVVALLSHPHGPGLCLYQIHD
jgi:hypothetical protein